VQQGDNRNNNFGQRDNGRYGNNYGQYGNNYGPYGNNFGRNFDQNEFNRRYYGRYGSDPNNFERNRQTYRVAQRWRERYPHDYVYADDLFIAIAARTMKSAARLWARFWVASWAMPYHTARAAPRSRESFLAASAAPALRKPELRRSQLCLSDLL